MSLQEGHNDLYISQGEEHGGRHANNQVVVADDADKTPLIDRLMSLYNVKQMQEEYRYNVQYVCLFFLRICARMVI
jgi:hypothetical protein